MRKHEKHKAPETALKDKVLDSEKLANALGALMQNPGNHAVNKMANIIYNMVLGVDPRLIGMATFIFRMWDAFTDPVMGYISDNSRTKWGRRRPWIILGAVLCGITFPLIWLVPRGWGEGATFTYLLLSCLVFFTCYTIFAVPYNTLAMELTPDYHEKTRVVAWRALFSKLSAIGIAWLFFFTQQFDDTLTGMRWVALGLAVVFVVFGVLPGLFVKERYYKQASKQEKVKLWPSIKTSLRCKPFVMLLAMVILMVLGCQMINGLGEYLNVYYLHGGQKGPASVISGLSGTGAMISSILSIPLFTYLAHRFGKLRALYVNVGFMLIGSICKWFLITPTNPYLMIVNGIMMGPGTTGLWVILASMSADICDYDEVQTGKRREGSFASIYQWILKLGSSLAFLLAGFILVGTGFKAELGGEQAASTFFWMRVFYAATPATAMLIILAILTRYPLTERETLRIRKELEDRRGAL